MRYAHYAVLVFAAVLHCHAPVLAAERPPGIVDAATVVPGLQLDIRYATANNFAGRPIAGYLAPKCYLSRRAAEALKGVAEELAKQNLGLKVYDCYRPRRAVRDFVKWGRDLGDQTTKARFYPNVDKRSLFRSGYIASRSGHSRASTVDLTIVPLPVPEQPAYDASAPIASCENAKEHRAPDNSVDMGTDFDCFSRRSHAAFGALDEQQKQNRALLRSVMSRHGFRNLSTEWWHYTLRNEPYPDTYFDFPVE
jgi:D-alanyl-D-alanine dipeptidase